MAATLSAADLLFGDKFDDEEESLESLIGFLHEKRLENLNCSPENVGMEEELIYDEVRRLEKGLSLLSSKAFRRELGLCHFALGRLKFQLAIQQQSTGEVLDGDIDDISVSDHEEEAVRHLRLAIEYFGVEHEKDSICARLDLAQTLLSLRSGNRKDHVEDAAETADAAIEAMVRWASPPRLLWIRGHRLRGQAYGIRLEGDTADNAKQSWASYDVALQACAGVKGRGTLPIAWRIRLESAFALEAFSAFERTKICLLKAKELLESVAVDEEAERDTRMEGILWLRHGEVQRKLGESEGRGMLEGAVQSYERAKLEFSRMPVLSEYLAETLVCEGYALVRLADKYNGRHSHETAKRALEAFHRARSTRQSEEDDSFKGQVLCGIGLAYERMQMEKRYESMVEALKYLREGVAVMEKGVSTLTLSYPRIAFARCLLNLADENESLVSYYDEALQALAPVVEREKTINNRLLWCRAQLVLTRAYLKAPSVDVDARPVNAAHCCLSALNLLDATSTAEAEDVALAHVSLARSLVAKKTGDLTMNLSKARKHCSVAMQHVSRERQPFLWASIHALFGEIEHAEMIMVGGNEALSRSLDYFQTALETFAEFSPGDEPSTLQLHVQLMFSRALGENGSGDLLQTATFAVEGLSAALQSVNAERLPNLLAQFHYELGQAYRRRASYNRSSEDLDKAIDHLATSIELRTSSQDRSFALANLALAEALVDVDVDVPEKDDFETAFYHCDQALQVMRTEDCPEGFAACQISAGNVMFNKHRMERSTVEDLDKAILYYENAATSLTSDTRYEGVLGFCLMKLAQATSERRESDFFHQIESALAFVVKAQRLIHRESWPKEWAEVHIETALCYLLRQKGKAWRNVEDALHKLDRIKRALTSSNLPFQLAHLNWCLGIAYLLRPSGDIRNNLKETSALMKSCAETVTSKRSYQWWFYLRMCTGAALTATYSRALYAQSIELYDELLVAMKHDDDPVLCARTQLNSCIGRFGSGENAEKLEVRVRIAETKLELADCDFDLLKCKVILVGVLLKGKKYDEAIAACEGLWRTADSVVDYRRYTRDAEMTVRLALEAVTVACNLGMAAAVQKGDRVQIYVWSARKAAMWCVSSRHRLPFSSSSPRNSVGSSSRSKSGVPEDNMVTAPSLDPFVLNNLRKIVDGLDAHDAENIKFQATLMGRDRCALWPAVPSLPPGLLLFNVICAGESMRENKRLKQRLKEKAAIVKQVLQEAKRHSEKYSRSVSAQAHLPSGGDFPIDVSRGRVIVVINVAKPLGEDTSFISVGGTRSSDIVTIDISEKSVMELGNLAREFMARIGSADGGRNPLTRLWLSFMMQKIEACLSWPTVLKAIDRFVEEMWKEGTQDAIVQLVTTDAPQCLPLHGLPGLLRAAQASDRSIYVTNNFIVPTTDLTAFDLMPRAFASLGDQGGLVAWGGANKACSMQCSVGEDCKIIVVCGSALPRLKAAGASIFSSFASMAAACRRQRVTPYAKHEDLSCDGLSLRSAGDSPWRRSTIGSTDDVHAEDPRGSFCGGIWRRRENSPRLIVIVGDVIVKKVAQAGGMRRWSMSIRLDNEEMISCDDVATMPFEIRDVVLFVATDVIIEGEGPSGSSFKLEAYDSLMNLCAGALKGGAQSAVLMLPFLDVLPSPPNGDVSPTEDGNEKAPDEDMSEVEGALFCILPRFLSGRAIGEVVTQETVQGLEEPEERFMCTLFGCPTVRLQYSPGLD